MDLPGGGSLGVWGITWAVTSVFLAGVLRGYTGFGFAIAAVPLLSLALPPTAAVPIVLALQSTAGLGDLATASGVARQDGWPVRDTSGWPVGSVGGRA